MTPDLLKLRSWTEALSYSRRGVDANGHVRYGRDPRWTPAACMHRGAGAEIIGAGIGDHAVDLVHLRIADRMKE